MGRHSKDDLEWAALFVLVFPRFRKSSSLKRDIQHNVGDDCQ